MGAGVAAGRALPREGRPEGPGRGSRPSPPAAPESADQGKRVCGGHGEGSSGPGGVETSVPTLQSRLSKATAGRPYWFSWGNGPWLEPRRHLPASQSPCEARQNHRALWRLHFRGPARTHSQTQRQRASPPPRACPSASGPCGPGKGSAALGPVSSTVEGNGGFLSHRGNVWPVTRWSGGVTLLSLPRRGQPGTQYGGRPG